MKHPFSLALALTATLVATLHLHAADHAHLNAGAVGTKQNDKLTFDNGGDFKVDANYVKTLAYTDTTTYAGYYQGNITLTALAQTAANGGPALNAPAPGSFIQARLVSVEGPAGGAFAFWNTGATNPTLSLLNGETGTNLFALTQSDGSPGADPFGHIHGRRFTATLPGIYKVGFQLFDTSTNGVGGGPIHTPSDVLYVAFEAGVNLDTVLPDEDHAHVRFAAPFGSNWQLEVSDTLGPKSSWTSVGDPVVGDDLFHELEDEHPVTGTRFYRVRDVTP